MEDNAQNPFPVGSQSLSTTVDMLQPTSEDSEPDSLLASPTPTQSSTVTLPNAGLEDVHPVSEVSEKSLTIAPSTGNTTSAEDILTQGAHDPPAPLAVPAPQLPPESAELPTCEICFSQQALAKYELLAWALHRFPDLRRTHKIRGPRHHQMCLTLSMPTPSSADNDSANTTHEKAAFIIVITNPQVTAAEWVYTSHPGPPESDRDLRLFGMSEWEKFMVSEEDGCLTPGGNWHDSAGERERYLVDHGTRPPTTIPLSKSVAVAFGLPWDQD